MASRIHFDVRGAIAKLDLTNDVIRSEVEDAMNEAARIGAEASKKQLNLSVTPWGLERMRRGRGNTAGRNDTGNMISKLYAFKARTDMKEISVKFGWVAPEKYIRYQEEGTAKIKAAFSLLTGRRAVVNAIPGLFANVKSKISKRVNK